MAERDESGGASWIKPETARGFVAALFSRFGVPARDAALVGEVLVAADQRGIRSHGLARVPYFLTRLERGVIAAQPEFAFTAGSDTTGHLDAANGIGIVAAHRAMTEAMTMASHHGSGFVVVKDSSHFGYAGFWAEMAMNAGFLGIAMSNSGGRVAPTFGAEPLLGTNPLAVAIPAGPGGTDFLLDMATSTVAVGKVETALREGRAIPGAWARLDPPPRLDDNGVLGLETPLLPLGGAGTVGGGHKGYGLALLVELLCGALGGTGLAARVAGAGGEASPAMGHLMAAIRIDGFGDPDQVQADVQSTLGLIRASAKEPGQDRIYIPGEPEAIALEASERDGIQVSPPVMAQLHRWAGFCGVEVPTA